MNVKFYGYVDRGILAKAALVSSAMVIDVPVSETAIRDLQGLKEVSKKSSNRK